MSTDMNRGWIKLHRQSMESAVFENPNLWKVWCYCLIRANHKENKILFLGEEKLLLPGQFITGRFEGSKDCKMPPSTFRNQLDKLKRMKNLDIQSDNKNSLITIVNWAQYQGNGEDEDSRLDNKRTTDGHRQECNNDKKEIYDQLFECFWKAYPKKVAKKKSKSIFLKKCTDMSTYNNMMGALAIQKESEQWKKENGQFIPHPSTWLNQERWLDEIEEPEEHTLIWRS